MKAIIHIDTDRLLALRNPTLEEVLWFIQGNRTQVFFDVLVKGIYSPHDWHPNNLKHIEDTVLYYFIDQFEVYNVVEEGLNFFTHANIYDSTYTYLEYFISKIVARLGMVFNPNANDKVYHLKDYKLIAGELYLTDYELIDAEITQTN